jgi:hypothetical protein
MRRTNIAWALAVCMLAAACGGGTDSREDQVEKQAEQVKEAADDVQKSAENMAKGLEDMAKGLSAMAGGDPNAKPVDPVSFKELQAVLPASISGWERSTPTGERMTMPVSFSQTEVRFTKGDAQITEKIVDSAFNQLLVAPFAMFLTAGYEKETESGYERSMKLADYPGWEKWDRTNKDGEMSIVVNKRFIVQVDGNDVDDVAVLKQVIEATDLKKLASLAQ